jgi:2-oxoglutarate ferredoxin oxidoreductase subunit alpha
MKQLVSGNRAIVLGALKAGLKFYSGYPITPASEIMQDFSHENIGFVNMVMGASMAGAKSMTATSGPGFSLMQEAIGFGHMTETPAVIVDVQRVGPSTGMPTLAHQSDIMQCRYGSHGDYYPIVFYPNSVKECYIYAIKAFNAAEQAQCPVILLSDAFLARLHESVDLDDVDIKLVERKRFGFGQNDSTIHITGLLAENGVPKTVDSLYYKKWLARIQKKMDDAAKKFAFYEYIENKDADTLLIAYGITSRVIMELKDKYSIFRPIRIFPMLDELKQISKKYKRVVVIEMNAGQYVKEVERLLKRDVEFIPQVGGKISLAEIKEALRK